MPNPTTRRPHTAYCRVALAVLAGLILAASPALAQPPASPALRPTVSPYLNLLQGNAPPVANYYGVVRTMQEFRQQNAQLTNSLRNLQGQVAQPAVQADLPETGHAAGFMNAGGYFKNLGGGLPVRGPVAPPAGPPAGGTRPTARR
jgi:hypothetical protein